MLTDLIFKDDYSIRYSLAVMGGVMMTMATITLGFGIKGYKESLERSAEWRSLS